MKSVKIGIVFLIVFIFSIKTFSQKYVKYKFDRVSNYKSQSNSDDLGQQNEFTFYNSNDPNYLLHLHVDLNKNIKGIILQDAKNNKIYHFQDIKFKEEIDFEKVFKLPFGHKATTDLNKIFIKNYIIKYDTLNQRKKIHVLTYENKDLKKLESEYSLEYNFGTPEINQQLSVHLIANLIWSNSISIPKNVIVTKFYYKNYFTNIYESWIYKNTTPIDITLTIRQ